MLVLLCPLGSMLLTSTCESTEGRLTAQVQSTVLVLLCYQAILHLQARGVVYQACNQGSVLLLLCHLNGVPLDIHRASTGTPGSLSAAALPELWRDLTQMLQAV